jgi:hypothetical protein
MGNVEACLWMCTYRSYMQLDSVQCITHNALGERIQGGPTKLRITKQMEKEIMDD